MTGGFLLKQKLFNTFGSFRRDFYTFYTFYYLFGSGYCVVIYVVTFYFELLGLLFTS